MRRDHHSDRTRKRDGRRGGPRHGGPEGRRGHSRRGRASRGDVRLAILQLLVEQPMHGYQLMQAIGDRSGGRWTPSPGAIYPAISMLEDEGLVTVQVDAGRKLVTLTDAGREQAAADQAERPDPFAAFDESAPGVDLRRQVDDVRMAARQVAQLGSEDQAAAAAKILTAARRDLYLLLADGGNDDE